MFDATDRHCMQRALELARLGQYSTPPNPAVGCVIVRDGVVVGEGYHRRTGEAHAEVRALEAAGELARGATVYVTLEPCAHHGRTPPCTDALLNAGVARVVAAMRDPNPHVSGGGLDRLAAGGIRVAAGLLGEEAAELNRGFVSRSTRGRPWLTLKTGASLDGRTALANGQSRWITGAAARVDVQRLRARASAILTGIGTVLADDPRLTVREPALELLGRVPARVVLDTHLRMPADARVLKGGGETRVFCVHAETPARERLEAAGALVEVVPASGGHVDARAVLERVAALGCNEVLAECGPGLAGGLLQAGLVDELVVYLAPSVLGDAARPMFRLAELQHLGARARFEFVDVARLGADLRLTARPLSRQED